MSTKRSISMSLLILTLLCALAVWMYLYVRASALALERSLWQSELRTLSRAEGTATEEIRMLTQTQEDRAVLDRYFVSKETVVILIKEIETLAQTANITLDIRRLGEGIEGGLVLELSAQGTRDDLLYFLALIESSPRNVRVLRSALVQVDSSALLGGWTMQSSMLVHNYDAT